MAPAWVGGGGGLDLVAMVTSEHLVGCYIPYTPALTLQHLIPRLISGDEFKGGWLYQGSTVCQTLFSLIPNSSGLKLVFNCLIPSKLK